MLDELIGKNVVIDLRSPFVCLGKLIAIDEQFLTIQNADFHDLRDTKTNREQYIADSLYTGIKRNRKKIILMRSEVIAISLLEDVVDE